MKKQRHLIVRSRNTSCKPLKEIVVSRPTILRLGSVTPTSKITKCKNPIEINTAEACKLSGDKILMKSRFKHAKVNTAEYFTINAIYSHRVLHYLEKWKTIIVKYKHSSQGNGIWLLQNEEDYYNWINEHCYDNPKHFVFEKYYTYSKEYRLHVTKDGCFCAARKMLKHDAEVRWHRHSNNSVWILEDNPMFDKPHSWNIITEHCVNALKSLKLDICCFDIKVQKNTNENPKFIILESNSAPALGEYTLQKYKEILCKNLDF